MPITIGRKYMSILSVLHKPTFASLTWFLLVILFLGKANAGQFGTPKGEEGTRIFNGTEHPNYSGHFGVTGQKGTLVGTMGEKAPWDHMDYPGKHLVSIEGTIEIAVSYTHLRAHETDSYLVCRLL